MKARWASKTKTARASPPLQPIPATMADESRTAMGFTPFPLYPGDNLHDLAYRLNFTRPISVDLLEFSAELGALLFLLTSDKVSYHVTRRGKAFLLLARF
jgi:hypothetical protein